mmetsp:Transcript_10140/g.15166  ORF Transcript_10140/g.15166 Transcript_10140/m.15166 type:complete len:82 (-) Transcript_10140:934-1179(-)
MVHKAPRDTNISKEPSKNKYPNTAEITIDPEVAKVFKTASAYFKVAATNNPPVACINDIITVLTVQPLKYCELSSSLLLLS